MDLNHTRLPIPPPEHISTSTMPAFNREHRALIYSPVSILQIKKSFFLKKKQENTPSEHTDR